MTRLCKTTGQLDNVSIRQSVELVVQASRGAEALHQAGLVHRDIKPGNIFVSEATVNSKPTAKLGDFGLVQILDSDTVTLTRAAETTGTPAYMSPEQSDFVTEVDSRSDVYSLGATLYHVLTGQTPFRGSSLAILRQVSEVEPTKPRQLNESVSHDLETILSPKRKTSKRLIKRRDCGLNLFRFFCFRFSRQV